MAYMNQERKRKIQSAVKPILDKYKLKGSLRCSKIAITLTIRSGAVDFISDFLGESERVGQWPCSVNTFWINEHWSGIANQVLTELNAAMQAADYYDRSDAHIDYFDTAYYYHILLGDNAQPYLTDV